MLMKSDVQYMQISGNIALMLPILKRLVYGLLNEACGGAWRGENPAGISCCFSCRIISYHGMKMGSDVHAKVA